jgi:hypothetical protein
MNKIIETALVNKMMKDKLVRTSITKDSFLYFSSTPESRSANGDSEVDISSRKPRPFSFRTCPTTGGS